MREIVHIPVGHRGNQIGYKFLDVIGGEHYVDSDGYLLPMPDYPALPRQDRLNVYYNETKHGKYVPRAVLVDLDPKFLKAGPLSKLLPPKNILYGERGTHNLFANGHYADGCEIIDSILDSVRKEAEVCDCMQGFQMTHSIGGGTGSGLGTLILSKLREEYPDKDILTFSVSPYSTAGDSVVAPYNAVLSLHQLIENTDQTLLIDNEALFRMYGDIVEGGYDSMNAIVSRVMSGMTSCYRFPSPLNLDLRKLSVRMVPYPRLHLFISAFAPGLTSKPNSLEDISVPDLTEQIFSPKNLLTSCDPTDGRYLATSAFFQGLTTMKELDNQLLAMHKCDEDKFAKGSHNSITAFCNIPQENIDVSATYVHNSSAIKSSLGRLIWEFTALFKRKAFLYPYTSEGMDEMEFSEALSNLQDAVTEYEMYQKI